MKVLLVNGSSHVNGTTKRAINEMIKIFDEEGVESEVIDLGATPISDCLGCGSCRKTGECVIKDSVNEFVKKAEKADGFVFATPVYYAHPSGRIFDFLDRAFYSGGSAFKYKPGAGVAVARRAGTTASLDALNKYFGISNMPIVGSTYWNMVHGAVAGDAEEDKEGLQTLRNLARNMVWMMRCIEAGKSAGIDKPEIEKIERTNFVR